MLKILDFGLARLPPTRRRRPDASPARCIGTPHYMSPEQIEGQRIDHRSDIFAVGLVLYELLTYRKAYPGRYAAQRAAQGPAHRSAADERAPSGVIDRELEQVVNRGD